VNAHRELVLFPRSYPERFLKYGHDMADHYARGGSPRSRARSGNRGTESNPLRLAQGKAGECATAIIAGLDPEHAIKWAVGHADPGWDVQLWGGTLLDVKTTFPPYKLIWSRDVNDLYEEKLFSILISASIEPDDFTRCWVEGWVTKHEFMQRKQISDGTDGLEPDTWFMHKADLRSIRRLIEIDREAA
jgi:hypothetical protein